VNERLRQGQRAARLVLPLILLWLALGSLLAVLTTRIVDWFVMTDELLYERLAISVGRLGSLLPHVHGELIANANQLYPLLIAPAFARGYVPDSLWEAHLLNAYVMSSACIPAFLLAHRVTGRRWAAYWVALLTVCVPWIVYSGFLLTEVVGYPVFLWAILALQRAAVMPSRRNDLLVVLVLVVAILARTQFDVLVVVAPLAFFAYELTSGGRRPADAARRTVSGHRLLAWVYTALIAALLVLVATGRLVSAFGTYGSAVQGNLLPPGTARSLLEHIAVLAVGLGILPFIVGVAWLIRTLVRPSAGDAHGFAVVGSVTLVAVIVEVTIYDLRFSSGLAADRYLFYLAPLVLTAFAAALCFPPWPRRSLLLPAGVVAAGFAVAKLPSVGGLNINTPVSGIDEYLRRSGHSLSGARAVLIVATVLLTVLFVQGSIVLRRGRLVTILALLTLLALPAETAYSFERLFRVNGTAGRPLTLAQGGVFDWVDRIAGTRANVTMLPYPQLPGDYWSSVAYWWDIEFWNKSVDRAAYYPGEYLGTPSTFAATGLQFDPATGAANASPTPLVLQSVKESRFRISGDIQTLTRDTLLINGGESWHADWLSFGLYDDGWTKPGVVASVRIFPRRDQREPLRRSLVLHVVAPASGPARSLVLTSNIARTAGRVSAADGTVVQTISLCQPAHGYTEVQLEVGGKSQIYGDMKNLDAFGAQYREGGVFLSGISVEGVGPACRLPSSR
jgi:hypothetical protein